MNLRDYQEEAIRALERDILKDRKSSLLHLPTGSGKTFTAVRFLEDNFIKPRKAVVFWVVHLKELLVQSRKAFEKFSSVAKIWIWDSKTKPSPGSYKPGDVVLMMVQSCRTFPSLKNSKYEKILVVDEAHREAAKSYVSLERKISPDYKLGLTATPFRHDRKELNFDRSSYSISLLSLARKGYLAKPIYETVKTRLKFDVKIMGDICASSLAEIGNSRTRNKIIVDKYISGRRKYGKTLIYVPSVSSGKELAREFRKRNIKAEFISHNTADKDRERIIKSFESSRNGVLINVRMFTEGIDIPSVRTIFMARPTVSKALWVQAVGRGSRRTEGKTKFYIVDFVDNIKMYPLLSEEFAAEILGVKLSKETIKAKKEKENKDKISKAIKGSSVKTVAKAKVEGIESSEVVAVILYNTRKNYYKGRDKMRAIAVDSLSYLQVASIYRYISKEDNITDLSISIPFRIKKGPLSRDRRLSELVLAMSDFHRKQDERYLKISKFEEISESPPDIEDVLDFSEPLEDFMDIIKAERDIFPFTFFTPVGKTYTVVKFIAHHLPPRSNVFALWNTAKRRILEILREDLRGAGLSHYYLDRLDAVLW